MEVWLLVWIACGVFAAIAANSKGRSGCAWMLLGFLFGPLGLLGVMAISPAAPADPNAIPAAFAAQCKACRSRIDRRATLCPHCRTENPVPADAPAPQGRTAHASGAVAGRRWLLLAVCLTVIVFGWLADRRTSTETVMLPVAPPAFLPPPEAPSLIVRVDDATLRDRPSVKGQEVGRVKRACALSVLEYGEGWTRVRVEPGSRRLASGASEGWIREDLARPRGQ